MLQHQALKARHPGAILFFRLGDFYEMFGDDALAAAPILDIVLTQRQTVPMCGVPHHSALGHIHKLIKAGHKVALCEQMEDPAQAKGLVERRVIRVITPGTLIEDSLLDAKSNNFLAAIHPWPSLRHKGAWNFALCALDISTGEFLALELSGPLAGDRLAAECRALGVKEVLVSQTQLAHERVAHQLQRLGAPINPLNDREFDSERAEERLKRVHKITTVRGLGLKVEMLRAAGALLGYVEETQKGSLPLLQPLRVRLSDDHMFLDETAVRTLEIVENQSAQDRATTLLGLLDKTRTAMGGRLIKRWLLAPLLDLKAIRERHAAVEAFAQDGLFRRDLTERLSNVSDVERILGRLASSAGTPRDLAALRSTLRILPEISHALRSNPNGLEPLHAQLKILERIGESLTDTSALCRILDSALAESPSPVLKEGGVIREGHHAGLDEFRLSASNGKQWIVELELQERERTGISSLKVGFTNVFGYYLEVTNAHRSKVPERYTRKQTLAGGERFITPELKEMESKILGAEERAARLEAELFRELCAKTLERASELTSIAQALAELDALLSFAQCAVEYAYVKPAMQEGETIHIQEGRHPVVERGLKAGDFVANDTVLGSPDQQVILLTGPNMSGKSTYLRQTALISIMAQSGSFVPATQASLCILDRIFTRIGAQDHLSRGESTFMVEMIETASILHSLTPRSLVILDEIGRGTSTWDGVSIARAAVEYLAQSVLRPKVIFATHYFELTELEQTFPNLKNHNVAVKEWPGSTNGPHPETEIIFLHKIVRGAADRSYGIQVARLAGLPAAVIARAKTLLSEYTQKRPSTPMSEPPALFSSPENPVLDELRALDINEITPMEALQRLERWKERLK